MTERGGLFLGVDVGGTSVKAVATDPEHEVVARATLPTDASDADRVLDGTVGAIRRALADVADPSAVAGIGIGMPGQVDEATGVVRMAMNLNIGEDGIPIGAGIADAFGLPTTVENDVRAAAVGAYEVVSSQVDDLQTLVYLSIGTGISSGVVIDGELHRGRDGLAGEIGHVVVDDGGPVCRCGQRGCLEAVIAGPALRELWPSSDGRHAQELFGAMAAGDPAAAAVVQVLTRHVTETVQWLALANGADLVVMGGGVGSVSGLLSSVRDRLSAFADRSELARRMVPPDRVTAMPEGHPTGAIGAAAVARRRLGGGRAVAGSKEEGTEGHEPDAVKEGSR
jgi:glucokinase